MKDERSGAAREPLGVEVVQTTIDSRKVTGPHVLASIHSESSHTHVNQLVHEVDHLTPDILFLQGEVQQTDQATVTYLEQQMSIQIQLFFLGFYRSLNEVTSVLRDDRYLIGITIVLNIATASLAFVVIEIPLAVGDRGEVLPASTEPAST